MLYASQLFRELESAKIAIEDSPDDIPELVAELLCHRVEQRIRRNMSHGYQSRKDVLNRVRGRIDHLTTERHQLLNRGKIACVFDELTVDTVRNRFVRAALEKLATVVTRRELAHRCNSLATSLKRMGVTGGRPHRIDASIDQFGRHDKLDQPMVTVAHLAFDLALPTEAEGPSRMSAPNRDVEWVRNLFEKGIAGFYSVVLANLGWSVDAGKTMRWQVDRQSAGIERILPSMRTDMILNDRMAGRRIVIDTKFNAVVTSGWYREGTLRSGYLYQMYAYLRSQEGSGDQLADDACGLLLHPSVGKTLDETVVVQGREIRFATVDLGASAREIRSELLRIVLG